MLDNIINFLLEMIKKNFFEIIYQIIKNNKTNNNVTLRK